MRDHRIRYWLVVPFTVCLFIHRGVSASAAGASALRVADCRDTLVQGIAGMVYRVGGNHMPDPHHPAGPPAGVRSTVYIFALTNISQVVRQGVGASPYYSAVRTRFIGQTETDDKGHFQVWLAPGRYSLFTKKGGLYYGSRMDEKNNIAPVEVLPGKVTQVECRVESDHKVVY